MRAYSHFEDEEEEEKWEKTLFAGAFRGKLSRFYAAG